MALADLARRDLLALAAALPFAGLALADAPGPEAGPFEIATAKRMNLVDPDRGCTIVTRAFYPAKPGKYPVIVFSHLFGGSLNTFNNTGKVWASHGYVVLHPSHSDSMSLPDPQVPPADAEVMRRYLATRGQTRDTELQTAFVKLLDDPFFIDSRLRDVGLLLHAPKDPKAGLDAAVLDRADAARLGMSGKYLLRRLHDPGAGRIAALTRARRAGPRPALPASSA